MNRIFYTEVIQKHNIMPFNLRNFEDETKAKMGVMECVNHKLIEPYQVLFEKTGKSIFDHYINYSVIYNNIYFHLPSFFIYTYNLISYVLTFIHLIGSHTSSYI